MLAPTVLQSIESSRLTPCPRETLVCARSIPVRPSKLSIETISEPRTFDFKGSWVSNMEAATRQEARRGRVMSQPWKTASSLTFALAILLLANSSKALAVLLQDQSEEPARRSSLLPERVDRSLSKILQWTDKHPLPWMRNQQVWRDLRNQADYLVISGDYDAALRIYNSSLALKADEPVTYANRGLAFAGLKQTTSAIRDYSAAINLDPKYKNAYARRGIAQAELGRLDLALADLDKAVLLDPEDAEVRFNRGLAYFQNQDFRKANLDFDEVIGIQPKFEQAYLHRGLSYSRLNEWKRALKDFGDALTLDPGDARAREGKAQAFAVLGRTDLAEREADLAVQMAPNDVFAYKTRAVLRMALNRPKDAIADYDEAIRLEPRSSDLYYNRAIASALAGDDNRALADYTKALELDPKNWRTWGNRGATLARLHRHEEAIHDFDRAVAINPDDVLDQANRGKSKAALGQYELAIRDYDASLKTHPEAAENYLLRGDARRSEGDRMGAIADFSKALEARPDWSEALQRRADAHFLFEPEQAYQDAREFLVVRGFEDANAPSMALLAVLSAKQLHEHAKAAAVTSEALAKADPKAWSITLLRHLSDELSAAQVMAAAKDQNETVEAAAVVGFNLRFAGQTERAREYFQIVLAKADPRSSLKALVTQHFRQ